MLFPAIYLLAPLQAIKILVVPSLKFVYILVLFKRSSCFLNSRLDLILIRKYCAVSVNSVAVGTLLFFGGLLSAVAGPGLAVDECGKALTTDGAPVSLLPASAVGPLGKLLTASGRTGPVLTRKKLHWTLLEAGKLSHRDYLCHSRTVMMMSRFKFNLLIILS